MAKTKEIEKSDTTDVLKKVGKQKRERGRPASATESVAKAVYFRDINQIYKMDEIISKHTSSSLSRIIQQLVAEFIKAYDAHPPEDHKVSFTANVYL